jgi:hypothetical protein
MYVNKKFMLLVAFIELQKLVKWAQILFNNLHSRLQDLSMVVKLMGIKIMRRQNLMQPRSSTSFFAICFLSAPLSRYQNLTMKVKRKIILQQN